MREITSGLILAGGAGQRAGGRDKGLLNWRGKPMASHVAERLGPQVDSLVVSCNRNSEFYASLGVTVEDSRRDFQGPLAGIEAAARHLSGKVIIIAPCDMPLIPLDLASRLLDAMAAAENSTIDISYAHDGERRQYLCAAIRPHIFPSLSEFLDAGQRAVHKWYALHRCAVVDFSDRAQCFANYNRLD